MRYSRSATAAYRNNRGEFANLIDSQNVLLDIETSLYTAEAAVDSGPGAPGAGYRRAAFHACRKGDKQMTSSEKRLFFLGAGAGVAAVALIAGSVADAQRSCVCLAACAGECAHASGRAKCKAGNAAGHAAWHHTATDSRRDDGRGCAGGRRAHRCAQDQHRRIRPRGAARIATGRGERVDRRPRRQTLRPVHRRAGAAR